jgi:hypothetical protein
MEIVPESEMPNMLGIDTSFSGRFMAHGGHHEKVGNNIINIQAGKIEVCRRAWVTLKDGSPTAFEKHIINYNTVFGDKSSRCTPAKISGPPTCGSL